MPSGMAMDVALEGVRRVLKEDKKNEESSAIAIRNCQVYTKPTLAQLSHVRSRAGNTYLCSRAPCCSRAAQDGGEQ